MKLRQQRLIAIALLSGNAFEKGNQKVYAILKNFCLEGEARPYIKVPKIESSQDGRALWQALKNHYEGNGYRMKEINVAHTVLGSLHYKKEYTTFTFETFIGQLTEHYNTLECHGVPLSEEQKVNSLLNKITNPTMEIEKEALIMKRYDKPKTDTFAWATNHLATKVKPTPQKDLRNVASINKNENNNEGWGGGRGRGGHGRGRGRGGQDSRGGCHASRGSGKPYAGCYKFDDWKKLTKEQKNKILETRGAKQQPETPAKWGLASVETEEILAKRTLGKVEAEHDDVTKIATNGNAGMQFGRAAHRVAHPSRYIS
jgi:hypothetical protein